MDGWTTDRVNRQIALWEETVQWVADNPEAYSRFKDLAIEKVLRGEKFSIGALTEVVRWDASIRFRKKDFKVKNGLRRYIAIKLMQDVPDIEAYITTKRGTTLPSHIGATVALTVPADIFDMNPSTEDDEDDDEEAPDDIFARLEPDPFDEPPLPIADAADEMDFDQLFGSVRR